MKLFLSVVIAVLFIVCNLCLDTYTHYILTGFCGGLIFTNFIINFVESVS